MESFARNVGAPSLLPPPSVETSFTSSSGSSSVEGECHKCLLSFFVQHTTGSHHCFLSWSGSASSTTTSSSSPAPIHQHLPRSSQPRPKSMIPKIQLHLPPKSSPSCISPSNQQQHSKPVNRNRLSLGSKPISLREIRSSSVGTGAVSPKNSTKETDAIVSVPVFHSFNRQ